MNDFSEWEGKEYTKTHEGGRWPTFRVVRHIRKYGVDMVMEFCLN